MADQTNAVLEGMIALVEQKAKELADLKRATNVMCRQFKQAEIFAEVDEDIGLGMRRLRKDQFYGKSPIVASREYLEARNEAVRAEEILDALERGGFDFPSQNWPEKDRLRLLSVSLSKNSVIFHRLPNGTYGLLRWYPDKGEAKAKSPKAPQEKTAKKAPAHRSAPRSTKRASVETTSKRPQRRQKKGSSSGVEEAVQKAVGSMSGRYTLDHLLGLMAEGSRDRARARTELNRLAQIEGSGVRLVKKGGLKEPAIYEATEKRPDLRIAK